MSKGEGLNEIYLSIRTALASVVRTIVPPHEIEDIVQETYVRLCQAANETEIEHPRSYLYKTARNLAFDHVKRAQTRLSVEFEDTYVDDPLGDATYAQAVSNEEFGTFCDAVRRLPLRCRQVFIMKKVYGFSQREIAGKLGLSESTVEKHVALAIKRCNQTMKNPSSEDDAVVALPRNQSQQERGGE